MISLYTCCTRWVVSPEKRYGFTTATASTSISHSGRTNLLTTTNVLIGGVLVLTKRSCTFQHLWYQRVINSLHTEVVQLHHVVEAASSRLNGRKVAHAVERPGDVRIVAKQERIRISERVIARRSRVPGYHSVGKNPSERQELEMQR